MAKITELKKADADKYLTIEEASEELQVKANALRNYLYDGKLTTYKFKTLTLLSRDEVESWKERRRTR